MYDQTYNFRYGKRYKFSRISVGRTIQTGGSENLHPRMKRVSIRVGFETIQKTNFYF